MRRSAIVGHFGFGGLGLAAVAAAAAVGGLGASTSIMPRDIEPMKPTRGRGRRRWTYRRRDTKRMLDMDKVRAKRKAQRRARRITRLHAK